MNAKPELEGDMVTDPVCGMQVEPAQNAIKYLKVHYAFCSDQCRERFLANPHLYIGFPGQRAPKQEGLEVLKQRRLSVAQPLSSSQVGCLIELMRTLMGIKSIAVNGDKIVITYDLLQVSAKQIEAKMAGIGILLGDEWPERLRRAFVHYEEGLEVNGLEVHETIRIHED